MGSKKSEIAIRAARNGPYIVTRLASLENSRGEAIPVQETIALCRCGASANKPFCDGTHAKIGFESAKQTDGSLDKRDDYAGKEITIHDNRGVCAHAGRCTDGLPRVWRMGTEPWIDPDAADPESIIETIRRCPSGALSYTLGGVEHRDQDPAPKITVTRDGPYAVAGAIELADEPRGQGASTEHYTLCRCGGSKNKPFCDGTHWHIKFRDEKN